MKTAVRRFLYPAWHWLKRDGVNEATAEANANQWLSTAELMDLQRSKLQELLRFAYGTVPYYRSLFDSLSLSVDRPVTFDRFEGIPPLTKKMIRDLGRDLIREDLASGISMNNSTSGSTGEALRFHTDLRSRRSRKASVMRSDSWTGWQLGDRVMRLWGAPFDQSLATGLRGRLHGLVTGDRFLSSFDLSSARMDEYIDKIKAFRPVLMVAYPGPLELFAIHCKARNVRFPSLRAIVSSAEMLWPHQRETIEDVLGVRVFNRYGTREVGLIGSECEEHNGFHVSVDRLVVEVVDDDNRSCEPGEEGRMLITDLDNYGMPLIRYEIGDRGVLAEPEPCRCGRGLPRLERIEGRTMDVVRTPDGRALGGTFWTLMLKSRPGFRQVQVVQDELQGVTINFVRDEEYDASLTDYFRERIQDYCGSDFRVRFVEKDKIDVTGSGKRRIIVSELTDPEAGGKAGSL